MRNNSSVSGSRRSRPPEAPELIPIRNGGFSDFGDWYEALGDAVFLERDVWSNYWYVLDARGPRGYRRVFFKIPSRVFLSEHGPRYNLGFPWGRYVEDHEGIPSERWDSRPKRYALNYSVRERFGRARTGR